MIKISEYRKERVKQCLQDEKVSHYTIDDMINDFKQKVDMYYKKGEKSDDTSKC